MYNLLWSKLLSISLALTFWASAFPQQVDLGDGDIDFLRLPFKAEFIARNHISAIVVEEQLKPSNDAIRATGRTSRYYFGENGACLERSTYRSLRGRLDTIVESFGLDHKGLSMLTYRRADQRGIYREVFERRADTLNLCRYRGKEGSETMTFLSCESVVTSRGDNQVIKTIFNDSGLPYKRTTDSYNSEGYLIEREVEMLVTRERSSTSYSYNDQGKLAMRAEQKKDLQETWSYTYEESGLLWRVLYRKDNTLIWRKEILHDERGLITAIITKDEASEDIKIERFSYNFR